MKLLLLLGLISINVLAQDSYIPAARSLAEGGTEYQFGLDYSQVTGIVDESGVGYSLAEGSSFTKTDLRFTGKYGFTSNLEMYGGIRARMINASQTIEIDSSNEDFSFSRSGMESALIGFLFAFPSSDNSRFALEGWYRQALHTNSEYNGGQPSEISLGDDSREIGIGLNLYYKTRSKNFITARGFYVSPSQTLSSEILTQFEYVLVWKYFSFLIGLENVYSLENDAYSSDPENKPSIYTGSSESYNSVNRSWTKPYLGMGLALGKTWRLEGRYALVTTGQSTDLGPTITVNLIKRVEDSKEFKKRDEAFKQYSIEGTVTKVSKARTAVVIDRGITSGLKKGMSVDFYFFDYVDGNQLIAKGVVVKAGARKSLVKIKRRYSKKRVEVGTVVRGGEIRN